MAFEQTQRDAIVGYVRECRARSERDTATFKAKLPRYYALWRGSYTGMGSATKNDVSLPLIYSTIETDVSRKMATSFGQYPYLNFAGYGPDDAPIARKTEALVSAQFQDARIIEKEFLNIRRADLYGRAISRVMWDHKEEIKTMTSYQALPLSGERVRQIQRARVVTFDGPNYEPVDLLDAFPCPGYLNDHDMPWFQIRYYITVEDAEFMASEAGGKVFDAAEVARIKRDGADVAFRADEAVIKRDNARNGMEGAPGSDKYIKTLEIIEHYGFAPRGFGIGINTIITVANDRYLFRAKDNPYNHRQKPIISYTPTQDPHYYFGPGKAEIAEKMQIVANRFINQQLDAADLVVHPMIAYNRRTMVGNVRNLVARPGALFGFDGPPGDSMMPIPFNMQGLSAASAQVSQMWSFMQMGSGIAEGPMMGLDTGGSDRETARAFVGKREAAGTRLMGESVMYEKMYLERLGNMFAALNAQLLEVPRQVLMLGDGAHSDPVTGQPIQTSRETINGWDLGLQFSARAIGSSQSIAKSARQQNDLQMFQILASAQPMVAGSINMVNFLRQMLRNLDYQNVNELIQKQPQVAEMLAGSGFQNAGQVPENDNMAAPMQAMGGEGPSVAGGMS